MNKTLIIIPTYNEKENIERLIKKIRSLKVAADILVVDDNSPDGTGKIFKRLMKFDNSLQLLHRKEKAGLGKAYVAGFKWGIKEGYKKLVSMDADFSHPPEALKKLIELCDKKTVAIGSRYIRGGKITGWKWHRYANSWGANFSTKMLLRIHAKDVTAGFKCYPAGFLRVIDLDKIQAAGYAFQVEMLLLAQNNGFKFRETPITFADRAAGESKIQGELKKSAKVVFTLATQDKTNRQFIKFLIVGAINTGVDYVVYYGLRAVLELVFAAVGFQTLRQISKAFSFIVSASSNYTMNRIWTFRSKNRRIAQEAGKFFVVAIGGLIINSIVFYLVTAQLHWRDIWGLVFATAAATLWNFAGNKLWTFKGN